MVAGLATSGISQRIEDFVQHYSVSTGQLQAEVRRRCTRYEMPEPVDVMLDSSQTPAEVILAAGRDISVSGIGLYANRPVAVGTEMVVGVDTSSHKLLAKAVAVHSTASSPGLFKIGARFVV